MNGVKVTTLPKRTTCRAAN